MEDGQRELMVLSHRAYQLSAEGLNRARWRHTARALVEAMVWLALLLLVLVREGRLQLSSLRWAVPVALAAGVLFAIRAGWVERGRWRSFKLILQGEKLLRRQEGRRDQEISRVEATHLQETPGHGFYVRTAQRRRFILVPADLEGYEELRAQLALWRMFDSLPWPPVAGFLPGTVRLLGIAGCVVALTSGDRAVVLTAGVLGMALTLWDYLDARRDPNADERRGEAPWLEVLTVLFRLIAALRE